MKSKFRGHKPFDLTAIAVARGACTYVAYHRLKNQHEIEYEHVLRLPAIEIAQAREWAVKFEHKLKDDAEHKKGSFKKNDFIFFNVNQLIAVEMKFIKRHTTSVNLSGDAHKLTNLIDSDSTSNSYPQRAGYVLLVGDKTAMAKLATPGMTKGSRRDEAWVAARPLLRNVL